MSRPWYKTLVYLAMRAVGMPVYGVVWTLLWLVSWCITLIAIAIIAFITPPFYICVGVARTILTVQAVVVVTYEWSKEDLKWARMYTEYCMISTGIFHPRFKGPFLPRFIRRRFA